MQIPHGSASDSSRAMESPLDAHAGKGAAPQETAKPMADKLHPEQDADLRPKAIGCDGLQSFNPDRVTSATTGSSSQKLTLQLKGPAFSRMQNPDFNVREPTNINFTSTGPAIASKSDSLSADTSLAQHPSANTGARPYEVPNGLLAQGQHRASVPASQAFRTEDVLDNPSSASAGPHFLARGLVPAAPAQSHAATRSLAVSHDAAGRRPGGTAGMEGGYLDHDPASRLARSYKLPALNKDKKLAVNMARWSHRQKELHDARPPASLGPNVSERATSLSDGESSTPVAPETSESQPRCPYNQDSLSQKPRLSTASSHSTRKRSREQLEDDDQRGDVSDGDPGIEYDFCLFEPVAACMLCSRGFKLRDTLIRHVKDSQLHRDNLLKPACRSAGRNAKLARVAATTASSSEAPSPTPTEAVTKLPEPKYRDRASERRAVFGSSASHQTSHDHQRTESHGTHQNSSRPAQDSRGRRSPTPDTQMMSTPPPLTAENNKGARMLSLMGWAPGKFLGTLSSRSTTDTVLPPWAVTTNQDRRGLGCTSTDDTTVNRNREAQTQQTSATPRPASQGRDG